MSSRMRAWLPAAARFFRMLGKAHGIRWAVAGRTAANYDDVAALHSRMPLVPAVAELACVLLLIAFRSVAIPLA
jgi:uncharacterized membrane protein YdfJ with MMPL/SSD domain